MSEYINNLNDFLKDHPSPSVRVISTLVSGGISCIRPVPRLFGAEVHCHENAYDDVIRAIRTNQVRLIELNKWLLAIK